MEKLIANFRMKCLQLRHAIRHGDDELVSALDSEIEPMITQIINWRAADNREMLLQLLLICEMIREDAGDKAGVLRNTAVLTVLLNRYLLDGDDQHTLPVQVAIEARDVSFEQADNATFYQAIVDSLPDRALVVTADQRIVYANDAVAAAHHSLPLALTGKHWATIVDHCFDRVELLEAVKASFANSNALTRISATGANGRRRMTIKAVKPAEGAVVAVMLIEQPH